MNDALSRTIEVAVQDFLRKMHADNAMRSIRLPYDSGAFPDSGYGALLHGESLAIVADTNILIQDLIQSCRARRRLTLINAANIGALRVFCAKHVVDEMYDLIDRRAESSGVAYEELIERWEGEYRPLLRVIPDNAVSDIALTPAENARIKHLLASKDIPSIKLAISIGALYLTEDQPARWAVYGSESTADELLEWVAPLRDGGSIEVLGNAAVLAFLIPSITLGQLLELAKYLAIRVPWLLWPALASGAVFLLSKTRPGKLKATWSGAGTAFIILMECLRPYYVGLERFHKATAPQPDWKTLSDEIDAHSVLLRACIWKLGRHPATDASAVELSKLLPDLNVGRGAYLVRELLRENASFHQVARGRWQLGRPAWMLNK